MNRKILIEREREAGDQSSRSLTVLNFSKASEYILVPMPDKYQALMCISLIIDDALNAGYTIDEIAHEMQIPTVVLFSIQRAAQQESPTYPLLVAHCTRANKFQIKLICNGGVKHGH